MHFAREGYQTQFIIEKQVESKLGYPYNPCLSDPTLFQKNKSIIQYILGLNQSHNQNLCYEYCFDLVYLENNTCNCSAPLGRF